MRSGIIYSTMALLTAAGISLGQAPAPSAQPVPPATNGTTVPPAGTTTTASPGNGMVLTPPPEVTFDGEVIQYEESRYVPYRFWAGAEYLLWRLRNAPMAPATVVLPYGATGLTDFTNTILYAEGGAMSYGARNGIRLDTGYWLDADQNCGINVNYFQLEQRSAGFVSNQISNVPLDVTVTVIPVQTTGNNNVIDFTELPTIDITVPAVLTVSASGTVTPTRFWGTEANFLSKRLFYGNANFDVMLGFRYVNLEEAFTLNQNVQLGIFEQLNYVGTSETPTVANPDGLNLPQIPNPDFQNGALTEINIATVDRITTRNQFYGGHVGTRFEWWVRDRLTFSGYGKVAIGTMTQVTSISGSTAVTGATTSAAGQAAGTFLDNPLTARNLQGGVFTPGAPPILDGRSKYAVIPEFNLTLGYQVSRALRATVGYNFLWISSVVRPGDQIGNVQNASEIAVTGSATPVLTAQPAYRYQDTTFWAQGLSFGLDFRY